MEIDGLNSQALKEKADAVTKAALDQLDKMTMTVVDGDFPREILAGQNLTFAQYTMPAGRNTNRNYDPKINGPGAKQEGKLILGEITYPSDRMLSQTNEPVNSLVQLASTRNVALAGVIVLLIGNCFVRRRFA